MQRLNSDRWMPRGYVRRPGLLQITLQSPSICVTSQIHLSLLLHAASDRVPQHSALRTDHACIFESELGSLRRRRSSAVIAPPSILFRTIVRIFVFQILLLTAVVFQAD